MGTTHRGGGYSADVQISLIASDHASYQLSQIGNMGILFRGAHPPAGPAVLTILIDGRGGPEDIEILPPIVSGEWVNFRKVPQG